MSCRCLVQELDSGLTGRDTLLSLVGFSSRTRGGRSLFAFVHKLTKPGGRVVTGANRGGGGDSNYNLFVPLPGVKKG